MKKLLSLLLTIGIVSQGFAVTTHAATVDYSAQLSTMKQLIKSCEARGINVAYEKLGYEVVNRFNTNCASDTDLDEDITAYNLSQVDEIVTDTIASLRSLLSGGSNSKNAKLPTMSGLATDGARLTSSNKPIFSVGYGHDSAKLYSDLDKLSEFGSSNVAIEVGPTLLKNFENPFTFDKNATEAAIYYDNSESYSGDYSIKVSNPTEKSVSYAMLQKEISCSPSSTYTISYYSKYDTDNTDGLYLITRGRLWAEPTVMIANNVVGTKSEDWTKHSMTFTTTSSETSFVFNIIVEGKCDFWIDDVTITKSGSSTNLFANGTFDEYEYETNSYSKFNTSIVPLLKNAQANNQGVNLLLSPHYFPYGIYQRSDSLPLAGVEYNDDVTGFFWYNVNNENAGKLIVDYIDELMTYLTANNLMSGITSIILTNEPIFDTTWYSDFYTPLFREYLENKHGSIATLNSKWGTSYSSFDEIEMPSSSSTTRTAIDRDWVDFNNAELYSFHKLMSDEVKKYTSKPVSIKEGYLFESSGESVASRLKRGTDFESENGIVDFVGFDQSEYTDYYELYLQNMMFVDYAYTLLGKPIYNSEVHSFDDEKSDNYNTTTAAHTYNHIWMSATHGQSMWSNWLWDYKQAEPYDIQTRPDVMYQIGKSGLDLARTSTIVDKLRAKTPEVAIFYSETSRLYDSNYMSYVYETYRSLVNMGVRVGFVTEDSTSKLSNYQAIILPDCRYTTESAKYYMNEYAKAGGKILSINAFKSRTGNWLTGYTYNYYSPMTCDEYAVERLSGITESKTDLNIQTLSACGYEPDANIDAGVRSFISGLGINEITVTDSDGNDVTNLDWSYVIDDDEVYINVTNLDYNDNDKELVFYKDGEQITEMENVLTSDNNIDTITSSLYKPQLLTRDYSADAEEPITATVSDSLIGTISAFATVTATNPNSTSKSTKIIVEALDTSGNVISSISNTTTIKANGETTFSVNLMLNKACASVRARIVK